jgi:hypothetical protein
MQCHLLCKPMFINYKISPLWRDFPVNVKAYSFIQNDLPISAHFQRRQNGAEAGTNYRGPAVRRGPGTRLCCVCCSLSRCYIYLSCVQIITVRPGPSYTAYESQSFRFTAKMFCWSVLAGGAGQFFFFFYPGPNPLSATLRTSSHCVSLITFVPYLLL